MNIQTPQILLAADTGLATFGLAAFDVQTGSLLAVDFLGTKKSDKKRQVSNSSDIVRRAREVSQGILQFSERMKLQGRVVAFAHESLSLPRNSRAAALIGISLGLVVHHAETLGVPILEVYPQDVKLGVARDKSASKLLVRQELGKLLPNLEDLVSGLQIARGVEEHPIDAAAVGFCALQHDLLKLLRGTR